MKNVVLLGDSIRMNYQDEVIKSLGESYSVYAPAENCRFSLYTLKCIRDWFAHFPKPDIIHWNNGLWDCLRHYPEDGCFIPLDEYIRNMGRILRELKKTGAKIIFATTTPTRQYELPNPETAVMRNKEDIEKYNAKMLETYGDQFDAVNDLYNFILANINEYICDDLVHLTEAGKIAAGKKVADVIKSI